MKSYIRLSFLILSFNFASNFLSAQIIHSDLWTGYWEGNGIPFSYPKTKLILKDTFLYFNSNGYGTVRLNTTTKEHLYLSEIGNPPLPKYINLQLTTIDPNGTLWTLDHDSLFYSITLNGDRKLEGPWPDYIVRCIQSDMQGRIWVGLYDHLNPNYALARFENGNWTYINVGIPSLDVQSIAFDAEGTLWFYGSDVLYKTGWYKYNGTTYELVDYNINVPGHPPIVYGHPRQLDFSTDGKITGAGSTVFWYFKDGKWSVFKDNNYTYAFFDENNIAWVHDNRGNLYKYEDNDPSPQFFMSQPENFRTGEGESFWGMQIDATGKIWIGMNIGLFVISDKNNHQADYFSLTNLDIPGKPTSIGGYNDTLWTVKGNVLSRLVNDTFKRIEQPQINISGIHYDSHRKGLWLCSNGQLGLLQGNNYSNININPLLSDSVNNNYIHQVGSDNQNNMWFLTTKELLRLDIYGNWFKFIFGEHYGIKRFSINNKDNSIWVRARWNGPTEPQKLFKIIGQEMFDIQLDPLLLNSSMNYGMISDSNYWTAIDNKFIHYNNGLITEYPILSDNTYSGVFHIINDTTFLVTTSSGLYVFLNNKFIKPEIVHELLTNNSAHPAFFDGEKLAMAHNSLLVLDNVEALLIELGYDPITSTEKSIQDILENIKMYPNPGSGTIYFDPSLRELCPTCSLDILSSEGKIYHSITNPVPYSIDLSGLPFGVYFLRIHQQGKLLKTFKAIRSKT